MTGGDLRCAFQRDDWQMSPAIMEVDVECKSVARLSNDDREGFGARRRSWPASSRFDAWSPVGRSFVPVFPHAASVTLAIGDPAVCSLHRMRSWR